MTNSAEVPGHPRLVPCGEVVVDADVGHRACRRAHCRADRHSDQWDEEQQTEQQAPEGATERARPSEAAQLLGRWASAVRRPGHECGIDDLESSSSF
jgi:hypothetical protein